MVLHLGGLLGIVVQETLHSITRSNATPQTLFHDVVGTGYGIGALPASSPNHYVVPYLSKRKTVTYNEDVRQQFTVAIDSDFRNLAAKLSLLSNPAYPNHAQYYKTCEEVLGFVVTAVPSRNGQRPGVFVGQDDSIPIEQMGEGVPNIVGLLAELATSSGKLFLMEEPENDLHPQALKALLELMIEASTSNQFVVSTHSNIVLRHLGAAGDSRVYDVDAARGPMPPAAEVRAVAPDPTSRLEVLRELGYSFSDFELWDGWLILEEASAERIIRDSSDSLVCAKAVSYTHYVRRR